MKKTIIAMVFAGILGWIIGWTIADIDTSSSGAVPKHATPLTIDVPEPCTSGIITAYKPNGEVSYQGAGIIKITSTDKNGRRVAVELYPDVE